MKFEAVVQNTGNSLILGILRIILMLQMTLLNCTEIVYINDQSYLLSIPIK